jgi:exopolysaccharide biosynthesis polyprenyl glycosylphosphotransferase
MPSFDSKSDYLRRLMVVLDLVIVAAVYVAAIKGYPFLRGGETVDEDLHFGLLPIVIGVAGLSRYIFARNLDIQRQTMRAQTISIVGEMTLTVSLLAAVLFLLELDHVSRVIIVSFTTATTIALILMRRFIVWWYMTRMARSKENHLRVLIVGSGRRAHLLADNLKSSSEWGVDIVGFLDPLGESAGRRSTDRIIGHVNGISKVLRDNVIEDVIVAVPRKLLGDVQKIIDACQEEGVRLRFMADIYDFEAARVRLNLVNDIPLLSFEPVAREEGALMAKRAFDLVVTLSAMPLVLPILALTALAIKLDSPGPVFFMQERVGLHKRRFKMYKFRSMVQDAEERMREVEHLNEASGPNFKIKDDPRMTRVGKFIRKMSVDELPQLINVLAGDMSLVGPRPMSNRDVALFDNGIQRKRFSVRPGITCIWQVSGRSDLDFDDWLNLDLEYIEKWTFWLDIRILLKTIPVVLRGSGAT